MNFMPMQISEVAYDQKHDFGGNLSQGVDIKSYM